MSWTRPRALVAGDRIGVCAPAGAVDPERLARGAEELRALGFDVTLPDGLLARAHFAAGGPERRAAELHGLLADDAVAGIVCARGGSGAGAVAARLDPALARAHPKVFVGFSDVTALHLAFARLGLVTVHGPMVAVDLAAGSYDRDSFLHALTGAGAPYASAAGTLAPLRTGAAEGRLLGGCLSLLASAAGTPWALRTAGEDVVLFLEDVDEAPYRIDRHLLQLRHSGALAGVRGIVFGQMKGCGPPAGSGYQLEGVLLDALAGLDVPVALGLASGHTAGPQVSLPFGVRARLRCGAEARLEVLEAPVS